MEINDLKVGDLVVLEKGDDIQMIIEEIVSRKGKLMAKCVWIDAKHKVCRKDINTSYLIYDGDRLTTEDINYEKSFKEGDEVNLKCCYNIIMEIEEIIVTDGLYKAKCRWSNSKNKKFKNIFNFTSLESAN